MSGSAIEALPPPVPNGPKQQRGSVVLDEANDLLVISEAGVLLPSAQGGWAEAVTSAPEPLSRAATSWAQEILATEPESDRSEETAASPLSEDSTDQSGGDEASAQTVDWIDW